MGAIDYGKHRESLRAIYIKSNPKQRYGVAIQRIEIQNGLPNQLIQVISAVEGFARSIVINQECQKGKSIEDIYKRFKNKNPKELLRRISSNQKDSPEDVFGKETFDKFLHAVEYRNLLIHEATYLQGGICKAMIASGKSVFKTLKKIADT
jgi:hypothetical protein